MARLCGAKTRSGDTCKNGAMANGRCRMHGGKTPETNQNAAKPGSLYSKHLTDEEQALFDGIELGSLDDEIRLTKIRLARALAQEQERGERLELDSAVKRRVPGKGDKPGPETTEVTTKRRDYAALIDRLTARIASLEARRAALTNMALDAELKRLDLKERGDEQNPEPPASRSFTFVVKDARRHPDDADDDA
ncbi:HGGxSTG domain-containing protein [Pandoraea sputorum]|uniref:HGGxSTG domain-containing protein n=1 Tax=Pandoraea sputorum TaxID=93222 RepID=UPI002F3E9174